MLLVKYFQVMLGAENFHERTDRHTDTHKAVLYNKDDVVDAH